jgi:nucleotide-binding universal stress UspA family protein
MTVRGAARRVRVTVPAPVLTAYDGHARSAVRLGEQLAGLLGVGLHVAVAYRYEPAALGAPAEPAPHNERRIEAAEHALDALSLPGEVTRSSLPAGDVAPELLQLAVELEAAAIVVGADTHGHVTRDIVGHATCPVAVAPHDPLLLADRLEVIGVAFDGTVTSRFALTAAQRLAIAAGARLDVLAVGRDGRQVTALRGQVDDAARSHGAEARGLVRRGHPPDELRRACEHLDLLVCGSRNRGALLGRVLGSVSSRLVDDPVCPILVVPVRARRDPAAPLGLTTATRA